MNVIKKGIRWDYGMFQRIPFLIYLCGLLWVLIMVSVQYLAVGNVPCLMLVACSGVVFFEKVLSDSCHSMGNCDMIKAIIIGNANVFPINCNAAECV